MSNCDHSMDGDLADRLKEEEAIAQYSGWDFCGYVWWDRDKTQWACEVWVYHTVQEVLFSDDLKGLMETVSESYGWN